MSDVGSVYVTLEETLFNPPQRPSYYTGREDVLNENRYTHLQTLAQWEWLVVYKWSKSVAENNGIDIITGLIYEIGGSRRVE